VQAQRLDNDEDGQPEVLPNGTSILMDPNDDGFTDFTFNPSSLNMNDSCASYDSDRWFGDQDCDGTLDATEKYFDAGGIATVQEDDSNVVTSATTLDFGSGFDVSEDGTGEADVVLDYTEDPPTLGTETNGNYVSSATASGGLELTGTEGGSLGMLTSCTSDQVLAWNGSAWACADQSSGGASALSNLSDVDLDGSESGGQILVHDNTDSFDNVSMSGDVTLAANGAATIQDDAVQLNDIDTDLITEAELSDESELEAQLTDVTDVFTNNDGALDDDDLSDDSIDALSDVDTTTSAPSTDDTLVWDGSNWVPGSGGASSTCSGNWVFLDGETVCRDGGALEHITIETDASASVAVGNNANPDAGDGSDNTAIGTNALRYYGDHQGATALGFYAGRAGGGHDAVYVGYKAGFNNPGPGYYNQSVAIGANALQGTDRATRAVAIGFEAGQSADDLDNSVLIGYEAASGSAHENMVCIGHGTCNFADTNDHRFELGNTQSSATPLLKGHLSNGWVEVADTSIADAMKLNPTDSPATCDAGEVGRMYFDDSEDFVCVCVDNSGSPEYQRMDDGTTCN
jgi:hypothetical protein